MEELRTLVLVLVLGVACVLAEVLDVMLHPRLAHALGAALDSLQLHHACHRPVTRNKNLRYDGAVCRVPHATHSEMNVLLQPDSQSLGVLVGRLDLHTGPVKSTQHMNDASLVRHGLWHGNSPLAYI